MAILSGQGFVLVGGRSERMGRDKALLHLGESFLAEQAAATLRSLGLEVTALARPGQTLGEWNIPVFYDLIKAGPLGALYTALRQTSSEDNFFLPCDMPLVPALLFERIAAAMGGFDVVAPLDSLGRTHPLCGYYSVRCLPAVETLVEARLLSVQQLLRQESVRVQLLKPEVHKLPDSAFTNLNTPEDLNRIKEKFH